MATPATAPDPKFRVKVYELNEEGEWGDKGTGHVQFQMVQSVESAYVFVHSEVDSSLLLESKIIMDDDVYQRQGETIISWSEPYSRQDLALSFAEPIGCQEIWEKLCAVRGVDPNAIPPAEEDPSPTGQTYALPTVEEANLKNIDEFLTDLSPFMREGVAATMIQEGYVPKLLALLQPLEEAKAEEKLKTLFRIVKMMIMMNETNLLEELLSDDNYLDTFGVFEYDPDATTKIEHRKFMRETVVFKQVVPFEDDKLVGRIHQSFRVQYLKEVVLPRYMDDATFGTLNSVVFFNGIEIVQQLQHDKRFLTEMFHRLKTIPNEEDQEAARRDQKDLLALLEELCNLSKNIQLDARNLFYKALNEHGVMDAFEGAARHPDVKCRVASYGVLGTVVSHDPSMVRVFMLEQEPTFGLLRELINSILEDPDHGIKGHASEILRQLLDPESMDQSQEKNQFLNTFYEKFLEPMITVFSADATPGNNTTKTDLNVARNHVCELLTFFVQNHGYRIKYFVLRNNIVGKVCELMTESEKYIALSAVRFVRACVGLKDEFYFRYMIKNNSFQPLVELFKRNGTKYNLLNSAVIELFEFIRKENIKSLVSYTVEKFPELKNTAYVDTFTGIWSQHEKNQEFMASGGRLESMAAPNQQQSFNSQDAEDIYFAAEDDEEEVQMPTTANDSDVVFTDVGNTLTASPGLVPYDDDTSLDTHNPVETSPAHT